MDEKGVRRRVGALLARRGWSVAPFEATAPPPPPLSTSRVVERVAYISCKGGRASEPALS